MRAKESWQGVGISAPEHNTCLPCSFTPHQCDESMWHTGVDREPDICGGAHCRTPAVLDYLTMHYFWKRQMPDLSLPYCTPVRLQRSACFLLEKHLQFYNPSTDKDKAFWCFPRRKLASSFEKPASWEKRCCGKNAAFPIWFYSAQLLLPPRSVFRFGCHSRPI